MGFNDYLKPHPGANSPFVPPDYGAVPSDLLCEMFRSMLAERDRLIAEQDRKIRALEILLKAAADCFRPVDAVIQ